MEKLLIIIPARGGSKGLARKNAKRLGDIPLLQWSSLAVQFAGIEHSDCILSTDDIEIADIGKQTGLDVPFLRPAELSGDKSSMVDVAIHALDWYLHNQDKSYEYVMILQPTSPFRSPQVILGSYETIQNDQQIESVIGVQAIHRTLKTLFSVGHNSHLVPLDSDKGYIETRRQEVEPLYTPNGAMYLVRVASLRQQNTFFCTNTTGIEMDKISGIDIDNIVDWNMAKAIFKDKLTWRHEETLAPKMLNNA